MDAQEGTAFFPGSQLAGQGLLVSDGETWRRQRQLANPAFRRSAVASYGAVCPSDRVSGSVCTWRRQRQLANPAFRRSAVASYGTVRPSGRGV